MTNLFLPCDAVLDPRSISVPYTIPEWREALKWELLHRRNFRSDLSGKSLLPNGCLECEMHEGILTRANVPKSIKWSYMIFHEYNCFLLLPAEHRPLPPNREWCILKAYERYSPEKVRAWFYSLPFKVRPFELP